jgi:triphosphoribosyl-dephospho-CoA synthetase
MKIENKNKLARLTDIDVYYNSSHSLNRNKPRTCYICNQNALVCSRMQKHTTEELLNHISNITSSYLKRLIKKMINEAMLKELNLHPKFGLVTPLTNGSHKDMDYNLMINAKNAILDDLVEMFMLGYTSNLDIDELFIKTRKIGIKADKHMFKATNNVNAYQGLIFNLGLVLVNLAKALKDNLLLTDVFNNIKLMSKNFINEGNFGARKQAHEGYQIIQDLFNKYDLSKMNTLDILIYFINNLDDTVLLRRCKNQETLRSIKERFKSLDSSKRLLINQINEDCIKNNLSFGGCADLLVVALFIDSFTKTFNKI